MAEEPQEKQEVCARCKRPIDLDSDTLIFSGTGKFWCDERCLGVRVPSFNHPHFER